MTSLWCIFQAYRDHLESFTTGEMRSGAVFRALPVYRVNLLQVCIEYMNIMPLGHGHKSPICLFLHSIHILYVLQSSLWLFSTRARRVVITVLVDGIAPLGARTSAGTVITISALYIKIPKQLIHFHEHFSRRHLIPLANFSKCHLLLHTQYYFHAIVENS